MTGLIFEEGQNGVNNPTILHREKPTYTSAARKKRVMGIVVLSVVFAADGRMVIEKVVKDLPEGLTESAIAAARKIRFNPATKDGKPVNLRTSLEFGFELY